MSDINITNTFVASTKAIASQVNQNFSDIANYLNARDSGSESWLSMNADTSSIGSLTATTASIPTLTSSTSFTASTANITTLNAEGNSKFKGPRPFIDVMAYGAVGDGSTDDTAAFNAAVAAASGGCVIIPKATYKINGQISIGISNVKIIGMGFPTLKQYDTNSYTFVTGTSISDVLIQGICFSSTTTTGGTGSAIQLNIANGSPANNRIKIKECYFGPVLNMIGIGCGAVNDLSIEDNVFDMGVEAQHALYLTDSVNVSIARNRLTGPGASSPTFPSSIGIKAIGCYSTFISGNYIYSWKDDGIYVAHQSGTLYPLRTIISNNIINSITKAGGTGIAVADATDTIITGNEIVSALNAGIIAQSDGLIVSGNKIKDCGTSGGSIGDGIDVSGSNIVVSGNTLLNFVAFGVSVGDAASGYISISDNIISGNSATRGVTVSSSSTAKGLLTCNTIVGCTTTYTLNGKDYIVKSNRDASGAITDYP